MALDVAGDQPAHVVGRHVDPDRLVEGGDRVLRVRFPDPPPSGVTVIEAKNLSKAYGKREVLKNIWLAFYPGAKKIDARTVAYESRDFMDVLKFMMFVVNG